jgi:hypothetical protein
MVARSAILDLVIASAVFLIGSTSEVGLRKLPSPSGSTVHSLRTNLSETTRQPIGEPHTGGGPSIDAGDAHSTDSEESETESEEDVDLDVFTMLAQGLVPGILELFSPSSSQPELPIGNLS